MSVESVGDTPVEWVNLWNAGCTRRNYYEYCHLSELRHEEPG
jgi:hypothetical protein